MSATPLLEAISVTKQFGGFTALNGVSLTVQPGERVGLIGPNGSGKSTLVNCLSGVLHHESGTVRFEGRVIDGLPTHRRARLGIARSFQIPKPFASMSVLENLIVPLLFAAGDRHGKKVSDATDEAIRILEEVGLADKTRTMSGGLTQVDMRKLELARAVAARPKLLIADEAMAGLSASEVDEILALLLKLNQQGIGVIMIEHIMRAVMAFSQRMVVLVAGKKIADASPGEVIRNPEVEKAYLGQ
ncbi:MAG TPA: ABC transporter ATP-binding protein [Burkholderiales bacterium]|nr:ABC transporter ATP-binding protein [Burkholderiales bacterium]